MIVKVDNAEKLNKFVYFVRDLYSDDKNFACPIFFSLKKELEREVLVKKRSEAVLCVRDSRVVGRILFGEGDSKQRGERVGYFSYFDAIEDFSVAEELFSYMENAFRGKVNYLEGTFSPFDPDTRRGVLVEGFDQPHTIFTSYNFPYYGEFLEKLGFTKAYDTYTVRIDLTEDNYKLASRLAELCPLRSAVEISPLDLKRIDKEVDDVHRIFEEATFELNYQAAPSKALIKSTFNNMKAFIEPSLVKIAREKSTGRPIGFCLVLKDYNEILSKTKGRIDPFAFIFGKNKIRRVRGMLQYVVPEYQGKGVISLLYKDLYDSMNKLGINYFEGGTIMEKNVASWKIMVKFGGRISKVYRIYGKEI